MKKIIKIPFIEKKINNFLLYLDEKLYTKRKYLLGVFRDIGHYLRIYPMLLRITFIGILLWQIRDDQILESIFARIVVAGIIYLLLRWVVPRKNYKTS
jgi:phage shock protein PspC (stress-responsive transcriptional regulator)